ncbi:hypothetical protein [Alsobacter sp. R-9]
MARDLDAEIAGAAYLNQLPGAKALNTLNAFSSMRYEGEAQLRALDQINAAFASKYGGFARTSASMESSVRPFLVVDAQTRQPINNRPPIPGEDGEAYIEWGKASNFVRPIVDPIVASPGENLYDQLGGGGFRVKWPQERDEDEDDSEQPDIIMQEVSRQTETVKVYDPDDDTNYIEVKRITQIRFRHSQNGRIYRYHFNAWD